MRSVGPTVPLAAALVAATHAPSEAAACGGTFCDAFTPGMPVDQTGEVILFVSDGDFVEAHVQIQYDGGDAQQFAWLVPVPAVPEIEVGSWRLVQAALSATRPVYDFDDNGMCEDSSNDAGVAFIRNPDGGGVSNEGGVGPDVVAQDVVGAFEYAVLQGGSADTVNAWLVDNDYATDDEAPDILDTYIAEGAVFVAFKLRHGAEVEDIHPVVIRYPGTEPCIPLRLTRIAAKDDMEITALFLGDHRVVPTTYRHVELNLVQLDWTSGEDGYGGLVSMAVDAPGADGRAFVTEYAGTSEVIDPATLDTSVYDSSVFVDLAVVEVVSALQDQGLASCDAMSCAYRHELVPSLLHEFVPVPPGIEDADFYGCLSCYAQLIDLSAWDGAAFAAAYEERIVAPLQHAEELLSLWPYVTRLYTRISPHEMIADPMFVEHEGLDDVPNRHGARRDIDCCNTTMRLPDGRSVVLDSGSWPSISQMPWAERVEEYSAGGGAPATLLDNTAVIDARLDDWNDGAVCDESPGSTGGVTDSTAGGQPPGPWPGDTDGGGTMGPGQGDGGAGGCGCTTGSTGDASWAWMLLGLGLGAAARRRHA